MNLINATGPVASYTLSVSATEVDEDGNFTTTVSTTNVDEGTTLYWELSGSGITSADFSSGALTGSGTISSGGFTFSHTLDEDGTIEGTETITIKLYNDSARSSQVGNTISVTINDTSTVSAGQQAYTTAGTYSWTCPSGVSAVSVVAIGGGGGGGATDTGGNSYYYGGGGGGRGYVYQAGDGGKGGGGGGNA